jgi:hypothetical protein
VLVGLTYSGDLIPLPLETGQEQTFTTSQGVKIRIDKAIFRFYKSKFAKFASGSSEAEFEYEEIEEFTELEANRTFTGDIETYIDDPTGSNQKVAIKQDKPYPLNISAMIVRGQTYD